MPDIQRNARHPTSSFLNNELCELNLPLLGKGL